MTTKNQHTADSRLPWRVVKADGCFEVWTRQDDTPGSRNNYMIAGGIQSEAEAIQLAASPELLEALLAVSKELDHWHNWQLASNESYPKSEGSIHVRNILIKANTAIMKATNL